MGTAFAEVHATSLELGSLALSRDSPGARDEIHLDGSEVHFDLEAPWPTGATISSKNFTGIDSHTEKLDFYFGDKKMKGWGQLKVKNLNKTLLTLNEDTKGLLGKVR